MDVPLHPLWMFSPLFTRLSDAVRMSPRMRTVPKRRRLFLCTMIISLLLFPLGGFLPLISLLVTMLPFFLFHM